MPNVNTPRRLNFVQVLLLLSGLLAMTRIEAGESQQQSKSPQATPPKLIRLTSDGHFKQRPAWSPDEQWIAFARHEGATIALFVRSADGQTERRLTNHSEPEYDAVWSPDGQKLVFSFVKTSPNQGDLEVHLIDTEGKNGVPFAVTSGKLSHEESPSWSPDGRSIAFTSTRDGNQEIYIASIKSEDGEPRRLTSDAALDTHPAWSPDGKSLAFATDRWGDLELALLDIESGNVTRLTTSVALDDYPAWSPDGKTLAFTSNRTGNLEIFALNLQDGSSRNLTRHPAIDNFPCWNHSGHLTFVSNRDGGFDIYIQEQPSKE